MAAAIEVCLHTDAAGLTVEDAYKTMAQRPPEDQVRIVELIEACRLAHERGSDTARWPTKSSEHGRVGWTNARGGGGSRGSSSDSVSSRDSSRCPVDRFRPAAPSSSAGGASARPNHSRARREDGQAAPGPRVPSDGDGKPLPRKKLAPNRQVPSLADFLSAEQLALLLQHPGVYLNSQPPVDPPAVVVLANNGGPADVVSNNAGTSAAHGLWTPPAAVVYDHASSSAAVGSTNAGATHGISPPLAISAPTPALPAPVPTLSSNPLAFSAASVDIQTVPFKSENIAPVSVADDDRAVSGAAAHVKTERVDPVSVSTDDRALPISSDIAHPRKAINDATAAAAEKKRIATVQRAYITLDYWTVQKVATLPFSSSMLPANAYLQFIRSVRAALSDILMICDSDSIGTEDTDNVRGWERAFSKRILSAIESDQPYTSDLVLSITDYFQQVTRSLDAGSSGPEAFAQLLRLLAGQFDAGDAQESFSRLQQFGVSDGVGFSDYLRAFRLLVASVTGSERALAPSTSMVSEIVRQSVCKQYPWAFSAFVPWLKGNGRGSFPFHSGDVGSF